MAYEVRYTDEANKGTIVVEDNTLNTDTSLQIPGRFYTGYGQALAENLLHLLENFASPTAPSKPIEGQLWYDNSEGVDQLKIYDGTSWLSASGLKKSDREPIASISNAGDLWVDTDNQQLFLYTGAQWILVGPSFSDGLLTGATPVSVIGQDNEEYTILKIDVANTTVAIISDNEFFLKSTIPGFGTGLKKGFNLSSLDDAYTFVGTADSAAGVKVTNDPTNGTAVISANDLLRADAPSTTNFQLRVKNNNGILIGSGGELSVAVAGSTGVIQHTAEGSSLDIRVKDGQTVKTPIRIESNTNVGINNLAPDESLDVIGNIQVSPNNLDPNTGRIIVNNTTQSTAFDEGSITTLGGIGIARNAFIGGDTDIGGVLTTGNVLPDGNSTRNIGSSLQKYDQIHSNTFFGRLTGDVTGTVSGRSGSAERLTTATTFEMTGDVTASSFAFDGKSGDSTKVFNTVVSDGFVASKTLLTTPQLSDEIIIRKTSLAPGEENQQPLGLYRVSKLNFLNSLPQIPVASMMPFGGVSEPDGWLICDGRIVLQTQFPLLFSAIQYSFLDAESLNNAGFNPDSFFAIPDMRGRFPLGLDNMGDTQPTAAGRVTSTGATELGNSLGSEDTVLDIANLPEHEHDLRGDSGAQYYAIRDNSGELQDNEAITYDAPTGAQAGQAYPSSGGIKTTNTLATPLDIMNPYLALNYIIYTGT